MLRWWLNKCLGDNKKAKGPKRERERKKKTLIPVPTFRHILWLRVPLKWRPIWSIAGATSIYGDERTSTVKLSRHVDPRASTLALAPQYSATQPDQRQRCLLHSSHSREPLFPFHSSAHGQHCDKTTCWRLAPNSMCHGLECFSFCACHCSGWPVATVDWFSEQTEILLQCCRKKRMEKEKSLRITYSNLCKRVTSVNSLL